MRSQTAEYVNLEGVELGFIVNLKTLRDFLKKLHIKGRRWRIATDPADAVENGFIRVGFGDPLCLDLLNTIYFRLPVLSDSLPWGGTDQIVLIFDGTNCIPDQIGLYRRLNAEVKQDDLDDFISFSTPVKMALIERMQTGGLDRRQQNLGNPGRQLWQ